MQQQQPLIILYTGLLTYQQNINNSSINKSNNISINKSIIKKFFNIIKKICFCIKYINIIK
jgi:hypothetical protein